MSWAPSEHSPGRLRKKLVIFLHRSDICGSFKVKDGSVHNGASISGSGKQIWIFLHPKVGNTCCSGISYIASLSVLSEGHICLAQVSEISYTYQCSHIYNFNTNTSYFRSWLLLWMLRAHHFHRRNQQQCNTHGYLVMRGFTLVLWKQSPYRLILHDSLKNSINCSTKMPFYTKTMLCYGKSTLMMEAHLVWWNIFN